MARRTSADAEPARLFLALWPPPALCEQVAQHAALWRWPDGVRHVPRGRWHITLHFIGNVAVARLPELQQRLAVPFESFDLALARPEVWPGGIALLRSARVPDALQRLHATLAEALRAAALPVETRAFKPHLTLARHAQGAVAPADAPPLHWRADQGYRLVRSLPRGDGYQTVHLFGGAR